MEHAGHPLGIDLSIRFGLDLILCLVELLNAISPPLSGGRCLACRLFGLFGRVFGPSDLRRCKLFGRCLAPSTGVFGGHADTRR